MLFGTQERPARLKVSTNKRQAGDVCVCGEGGSVPAVLGFSHFCVCLCIKTFANFFFFFFLGLILAYEVSRLGVDLEF